VPNADLVFVVRDASHVPDVATLEVGGELRGGWVGEGKGKTARVSQI